MSDQQLTVKVQGVREESTVSLVGGKVERSLVLVGAKPELKSADRIVSVNQNRWSTQEQLLQLFQKFGGAPLELVVVRPSEEQKGGGERLTITVNKKPGQPLGLGAQEDKEKGQVSVSSLSGVAKETSLKVGDHIVSVNDKGIKSLQDLREVAGKANTLVLQVCRTPDQSTETSETSESEAEEEEQEKINVVINKRADQPLGLGCKEDKEEGEVHVSSLSGVAKESKLQVGDQLLEVNGKKIKSLKDLKEAVGTSQQINITVGRAAAEETEKEKEKEKTPESEGGEVEKEVDLEIYADEGEPIGVYPDERLRIVRIQPGSIGAEKFKMGDVIKKVNKWPVSDVNHFFRAIERSPRPLQVSVNRSVAREKEAVLKQLPPHLEKLIRRQSGFEYMVIPVSFNDAAGRHFGLALANCAHNKVLVTGIKEGSVSADHFKLFDRICAINGTPVTDENVAKSYICASGGNFQTVVERPTVGETQFALKREYEQWKAMRLAKQREHEMPTDIQEIVAKESERRKSGQVKACKPALAKKGSPAPARSPGGRLSWHGSHTEVQIQSDVPEGKRLRRVS